MGNAFEISVDNETPESWANIIGRFRDASIYQTWAYGAVRWGEKNLSHVVLRDGPEAVAAAQLRIVRIPVLPLGIAYLRWGPMCHRIDSPFDSSVLNRMLAVLKEEYARCRRLSLQIVPNAFGACERTEIFERAFSGARFSADRTASSYRTILVDLSRAPDVMRKQLDQKWRNQLNRSERNALQFEISRSAEAYAQFLLLYEEMWTRKQFETSVDPMEFGKIQERLSPVNKMDVFIARSDGQPVAAIVGSHFGETAIYLLGATSLRGRELKAAYFLQWQAMMYYRERGALLYDLGGVDADANPGGYHFKNGFGGTMVTRLSTHSYHGGQFSRMVWALASTWQRRHNLWTSLTKSAGT